MNQNLCKMTKLFCLRSSIILIAIVLSGCASYSTIGIPAGEEFVLGEQENSSFRAELKNLSTETINVRAVDKTTGEQTQGFGLAGKGQTKLGVSRKETVILSNPTTKAVKVRAKLSRSVEGMRYQQMPKTEPTNDDLIKTSGVSGQPLHRDSLPANNRMQAWPRR